jgi:large subunit ribosomal protein L17
MKHRKTGRKFGRVRSQRKALLMSLMSSLIVHGRIETTQAKAKETKSAIDKVITKAKRAKENPMEITRKIENDLSSEAVGVVVKNIDKFGTRTSGYARVVKIAPRRSDASPMAIIELIDLAGKKDSASIEKKEIVEKSQEKEKHDK